MIIRVCDHFKSQSVRVRTRRDFYLYLKQYSDMLKEGRWVGRSSNGTVTPWKIIVTFLIDTIDTDTEKDTLIENNLF